MKTIGRVEVPQEAFVAALSSDAAERQAEEVGRRAVPRLLLLLGAVTIAAGCAHGVGWRRRGPHARRHACCPARTR